MYNNLITGTLLTNKKTRNARRLLIQLLLILLPLATQAATHQEAAATDKSTLKPFSLTYKAKYAGLPFSGTAFRRLQYDPETQRYTLITQANSFLMQLKENAQFRWDQQQCQAIPIRYEYKRSGIGKNKHHWVEFAANRQEATYYSKNRQGKIKSSTYETPSVVADRLSEITVLRCKLMQGASQIEIDLVRKSRVVTHSFQKVAEEVLETPIGPLKSIKVARVSEDGDKQTFAWFAPEHNYWLIRLEQVEDNKRYTVMLQSID